MLTLPGVQVTGLIHEGPRTVVYRGVWKSGAPAVLKVAKGATPTLQQFSRWSHEHSILQQVRGDSFPKALALEVHQNRPVLVLEDIGADSLRNIRSRGELPLATFFDVGIQIALALSTLHKQGIIHKDVNPSNVVYNEATGRAQLIDFGISSRLAQEMPKSGGPQVIEGTLLYLSPEQTGRMNRVLDYRSDFYSLGATFYELLTGAPPFSGGDWMEIVHCHMAKQPEPPAARQRQIPQAISAIVMKLLNKTAEERYQSAAALATDLRRCRDEWKSGAPPAPFEPGQADVSDRLQLSQRLYGREEQRKSLLAAYDEAARGTRPVLVMVAGYSGVGKSSLVHEIHRPIVERRGFFASGKCDQFQRNEPYRALLQAFAELARQVLAGDAAWIARWKGVLLAALGPNARVITDLIPEVGLILGPQPEVAALSAAENQNRFHLLVQSFVRSFAKPEHPLVLFLDDLQWADLPTLRLLERLAGDLDGSSFLIIGAYRDNQVDAAHPLSATLGAIGQKGTTIHRLALGPLSREHLVQLTSDVLGALPVETGELARVLWEKTHGNPFFVNRLLTALYEGGLIERKGGRGAWTWNLDAISAMAVTENVVDLMSAKLRTLAPQTRQVLQLAACIGSRFDLATLAIVFERGLLETGDVLWEAIKEHLIAPQGDGYKLLQGIRLQQSAGGAGDSAGIDISFKFVHDQIQQAAYAEVDEARNRTLHLKIGRLLREKLSEAEQQERLFEIVHHFNEGAALIEAAGEKAALVRLNLAAGKKARASAAFSAALGYLETALGLLGEDAWKAQYALTLELHLEAAEAAYLATDFAEMSRVTQRVQAHAVSLIDKVRAYEVQIDALVAQNKLTESVDTGLSVLRLLGVRLPRHPGTLSIVAELMRSKLALAGKKSDLLRALPRMTDPVQLAIMRILTRVVAPAYMCAPKLLPILVFREVILSVKHGNAPSSAYAYAAYGMILGGILGDADAGERFGTLALDLQSDTGDEQQKPRVWQVAHSFTRHWKHHARVTLGPLLEAFQSGAQSGDFEYAAYACLIRSFNMFSVGVDLATVETELSSFIKAMAQFKHEVNHRYLRLWRQAVQNLRGQSEDPTRLVGESYDERTLLPEHEKNNDVTGMFYAHYNHLVLRFLFGRIDEAAESAALAERYQEGVTGVVLIPRFHFFAALTDLKKKGRGADIASRLKKLQKWSVKAPMNFRHLVLLLQAELAQVEDREAEAIRLYNDAVSAARAHEYLQDEALANELAAGFYLAKGLEQVAAAYLRHAHLCYARWGAAAKVRSLEEKFPTLMSREDPRATATSGSVTKEALDVGSILKASQAISGEIIFDELLRGLMKIAIENAGATRGALLLQNKGAWGLAAIQAVNEPDVTLPQGASLETFRPDGRPVVPASMVHYAANARKATLLGDSEGSRTYSGDPYFVERRPKSALCVPMQHQGQIIGVLYLENDLAAEAFSPQRIEVLTWLSAQMAISISNARLYELLKDVNRTLELQVEQRTKEAEQARKIAEQASAAKSQFLANTSHEIRTPLTALLGFADLLGDPKLTGDNRIKYAQTIRRNAEHLLSLINNILDLSKIEAGKMSVEVIDCPLADLVSEVGALMQIRAVEQKLDFDIRLATPIPAVIRSDPTRLKQILINLLGNAIKFTSAGQVTLAVAASALGPRTRLAIDVTDSGIGMDEEQLARLFQPFEQADPSMTRRYGGSGLGLAVCKLLAEALGGSISVRSKKGSGSTFTLSLAVDVPPGTASVDALRGFTRRGAGPAAAPERPARETPAEPAERVAARVLLAEDGEDNQLLLDTLLRGWGFVPTLVPHGRAAVETAMSAVEEGKPYDIIIMDMQMPILDGYGATAELRAKGYTGVILALTAHAMTGERERCLEAGCNDYLSKPLDRQVFRATVERHAAARR